MNLLKLVLINLLVYISPGKAGQPASEVPMGTVEHLFQQSS